MDSGNSSSLQSSSGADDEFDSRCGGGGEDDTSLLFALLRQPPSSASVLPMTGFGGSLYGIQDLAAPPPTSHWASTTPLPAAAVVSPPLPSGQADAPAAPPVPAPSQGSRKRTRASRRAPTTVLTTDTSNFRAMVQEFTGIPSLPFAASARPRFDHHHHFPSRPTAALSPYLLRTFASQAVPYPQLLVAAPPANTASTASPTTTTAVGQRASYDQIASAAPSLGMRDHSGSGGNCLSFQSPTTGAQLLDGNNASRYPIFDGAAAQRRGVTNSRHRGHSSHGGDDDLPGLVGAASVSCAGGCKTYAPPASSASRAGAPRPADLNAQSTTPAVSAQGVEPSWICTSE